jgi:hypothetical protein
MDIIQRVGEPAPEVGKRIMCRHPFEESKRANVTPARVEELLYMKEVLDKAQKVDLFEGDEEIPQTPWRP